MDLSPDMFLTAVIIRASVFIPLSTTFLQTNLLVLSSYEAGKYLL